VANGDKVGHHWPSETFLDIVVKIKVGLVKFLHKNKKRFFLLGPIFTTSLFSLFHFFSKVCQNMAIISSKN
jgi:hypothetical protein